MPWVAIVERDRANCGVNMDLTYVNVLSSVRQIKTTASAFVSQNPTHPWANPGFREYIVDIPDALGQAVRGDANALFHDEFGNEPKWQNQNGGSGSTFAKGSFADPTDAGSVFSADVVVPDDRWILRVYDGDPDASGNHIASIDLEEGQGGGEVAAYLKLFTKNNVATNINAADRKADIAGTLFIFDFGSAHSPALGGGVTTVKVKTDTPGRSRLSSGASYRIVGPAGQQQVWFNIYARSLRPR